jgi:hypothetical protein
MAELPVRQGGSGWTESLALILDTGVQDTCTSTSQVLVQVPVPVKVFINVQAACLISIKSAHELSCFMQELLAELGRTPSGPHMLQINAIRCTGTGTGTCTLYLYRYLYKYLYHVSMRCQGAAKAGCTRFHGEPLRCVPGQGLEKIACIGRLLAAE